METAQKFLKTKNGNLSAAFAGLVLAYLMASRAIDTGSLWEYIVALILIIISIKYGVRAFKKR